MTADLAFCPLDLSWCRLGLLRLSLCLRGLLLLCLDLFLLFPLLPHYAPANLSVNVGCWVKLRPTVANRFPKLFQFRFYICVFISHMFRSFAKELFRQLPASFDRHARPIGGNAVFPPDLLELQFQVEPAMQIVVAWRFDASH